MDKERSSDGTAARIGKCAVKEVAIEVDVILVDGTVKSHHDKLELNRIMYKRTNVRTTI